MLILNGKITESNGSPTGCVAVPYNFGGNTVMDHLNTSYYHVHGQSFVYPAGADNVTLTAGSGAWDDSGAKTEVIPAGTLTTANFDLHWLDLSNISGTGTVEVRIFKGTEGNEVQIGAVRANRSTNQARNGPAPVQIPQQASGERISCQLLDSTAGALTCQVSFAGHYYA